MTVKVVDFARHQGSTSFAWTVTVPPAITSADSAAFTVGEAGTVTVTSNGVPTPSISETGPLPSGITFSDQGDGTATLSGIPGEGTAGTYPIILDASNGPGSGATQSFTLTVDGGSTASLVLSPTTATIASGASQTYSALGLDIFGTSTGDVTALTTFTIAPAAGTPRRSGPSVAGSSCTAESPGTYTVTGADGTATARGPDRTRRRGPGPRPAAPRGPGPRAPTATTSASLTTPGLSSSLIRAAPRRSTAGRSRSPEATSAVWHRSGWSRRTFSPAAAGPLVHVHRTTVSSTGLSSPRRRTPPRSPFQSQHQRHSRLAGQIYLGLRGVHPLNGNPLSFVR